MSDHGDWVGTVSVGRILDALFPDARPDAYCWNSISQALLANADENFNVWEHAEQLVLFDLLKQERKSFFGIPVEDQVNTYRTMRLTPQQMREIAADPMHDWPLDHYVMFGIREVSKRGEVRRGHDGRSQQVSG